MSIIENINVYVRNVYVFKETIEKYITQQLAGKIVKKIIGILW